MKTNTPGNGMKREGTESRGCTTGSRWKPELCQYTRWKETMHDPMVLGGAKALVEEIIEVLDQAVSDVRDCAFEYACSDAERDEYDQRVFRMERIISYLETTKFIARQAKLEAFQ